MSEDRATFAPNGRAGTGFWLRERAPKLLMGLFWLAALSVCGHALLVFALHARSRLFERYAIWLLEPVFQRTAWAWRQGTPLYGPPTLDYVPTMYNPGSAWLNGSVLGLTNPGLIALRLVAFSMFLALVALIAVWVYRATRDPLWTAVVTTLAVGVAAGVRHFSTAVNIDSAFVFWGLLAAYLVYWHAESRAAVTGAALCAVASFLFKQPGALFGVAIALYLLKTRVRSALLFGSVCTALVGAVLLYYTLRSDGWYWVYVVQIPGSVGRWADPQFLRKTVEGDPLAAAAFVACLPVVLLLNASTKRVLWAGLWLACLGMAYFGLTKFGGDTNSLLPLYGLGVLLLGVTPAALRRSAMSQGRRRVIGVALVALGVFSAHWQMAGLRAEIGPLRSALGAKRGPTYPHLAAFERRIAKFVASVPGDVFVGGRFTELVRGGRALNAHQLTMLDGLLFSGKLDVHSIAGRDLALQRYAAMAVWNFGGEDPFRQLLIRYYRIAGNLGIDPEANVPVEIWVPRKSQLDLGGSSWAVPE